MRLLKIGGVRQMIELVSKHTIRKVILRAIDAIGQSEHKLWALKDTYVYIATKTTHFYTGAVSSDLTG